MVLAIFPKVMKVPGNIISDEITSDKITSDKNY
jgi:hypothetical protein